jgi:hypothetical protein
MNFTFGIIRIRGIQSIENRRLDDMSEKVWESKVEKIEWILAFSLNQRSEYLPPAH